MNKQLWFNKAKSLGIEQLEIYESIRESCSIDLYESQIDSYKLSTVDGICIRAIINGHNAQVYLEEVNDEMMDDIFTQLQSQAKYMNEKQVDMIKGASEYPIIKRQNNEVIKRSNEEKIALLHQLEQALLKQDVRVKQVVKCLYSEGIQKRSICNSLGMDLNENSDCSFVLAGVMVSENGQNKSCYDLVIMQKWEDLDVEAFASKLVKKACSMLNSESIPSGSYQMIMEKDALIDMLSSLTGIFNGENAYKGLSVLKDKLGEQVFSSNITIKDDALMENGIASCSFDDEGIACENKVVVDKGVLKTYLHNRKSAEMMNCKSSGNGFKAGYASPISIAPTNFYIDAGNKSFDELVKIMHDGIIVTGLNGLHAGLNSFTTKFSLQAEGYLVKDGNIVKAIDLFTIASSFMEMMNDVVAVGSDLKHDPSGIGAPSLLIGNIKVSGSN